jgi:hypothetical protein
LRPAAPGNEVPTRALPLGASGSGAGVVAGYPLERIDFRPWARAALGVERLEDLHELPDPRPFASYPERLRHHCELLKGEFAAVEPLYLALVDLIGTLLGGLRLRQTIPSFRCHLVGAGTASALHRDGDPKYGVSEGVINGWVPLTAVDGANSLWVESAVGAGDHAPVSLRPGEVLLFDAFHLEHGSVANSTESSRVSFDFRFIPDEPDRLAALSGPAGRARHGPPIG